MNFQEILDEHGVAYFTEGPHTRPGWLQLEHCPFCQGPMYAGYSTYGGHLHCWRCGQLPLVKTLSLLIGKPYGLCSDLLKQIDLQPEPSEHKRTGLVLPSGLGPLLPIHKRYLRSRGFDPDELQAVWGIKGIGLAKDLPWRIFIPFMWKHQCVSWTTRAVSDSAASRYISASPKQEAMNAKKLVFGMDFVRHAAIVVEGPFDVFRLGVGTVSTLGVGFSYAQVARIARVPSRAICYDSEPKAQERAKKLCAALEGYPGRTYRVEIDSKDPGSMKKRYVELLRKQFLGD